MDGPRDYHTKRSKSDKDKITLYHLYVESKKIIHMNIYTKQTQRHRKQIYG